MATLSPYAGAVARKLIDTQQQVPSAMPTPWKLPSPEGPLAVRPPEPTFRDPIEQPFNQGTVNIQPWPGAGRGFEPIQPDMGFMPVYEDRIRGADRRRAEVQSEGENTVARIKQMIEQNTGLLNQNRQKDEQYLKDRLASQGIIRSGITVGEQSKLGEEYGNRIQQLNQEGATRMEDVKRAIAQQMQSIQEMVDELRTNQARDRSAAQLAADRANAEREAAWRAYQEQQQQLNSYVPQPTPTGQYAPSTPGVTPIGSQIQQPGQMQFYNQDPQALTTLPRKLPLKIG